MAKLLFLSRWFPYPPDNGSKLRIFNLLRHLGRAYDVTLICFQGADEEVTGPKLAALAKHHIRVRAVPYHSFRPSSARALRGFLSTRPRSLVDTESREMRDTVDDEWTHCDYDVVVASELDMIPYALQIPGTPALLEDLELATYRDSFEHDHFWLTRMRRWLTWWKLRSYIRRTLPRFAACTVVSDVERAHLCAVIPTYTSIVTVPNAVDTAKYDADFGHPEPETLIWSGSLTYRPNYEAVQYFIKEILPRVMSAVPNAKLRITGHCEGIDLGSLQHSPGVEFTGYLEDVRPAISRSWASVVPLRTGGGTRLKILESMALGTPVVATKKGAEGLEVNDGQNILIAENPDQFAGRVVSLLGSPHLRTHLSMGGRDLVRSRYDWEVVAPTFTTLVEDVRRRGSGRS